MKIQVFTILISSLLAYLLLHSEYNLQRQLGVINSIGQKMVYIPPGVLDYGTLLGEAQLDWKQELSAPDYSVELGFGYFMAQTEVTQKQWNLLMPPVEDRSRDCLQCPQDNVGLPDVYEFLNKLNQREGCSLNHLEVYDALFQLDLEKISGCYRLPTQDEFVYACEGGNGYLRERSDLLVRKNSWYSTNSYGLVKAVGQKQPNGYGLYDMVGNVDEFVYPLEFNSTDFQERRRYKSLDRMKTSFMMGGHYRSSLSHASCGRREQKGFSKTGRKRGFRRRDSTGFRVVRQP